MTANPVTPTCAVSIRVTVRSPACAHTERALPRDGTRRDLRGGLAVARPGVGTLLARRPTAASACPAGQLAGRRRRRAGARRGGDAAPHAAHAARPGLRRL